MCHVMQIVYTVATRRDDDTEDLERQIICAAIAMILVLGMQVWLGRESKHNVARDLDFQIC